MCRADRLLPALALIFKEAFSPTGVFGGFSGYALLRTMSWGFRRGIFSNEAGLGSSTVIHAESTEKVPYKQGYWGIFEVFFDTCVICTLTALVLLVSGVLDGAAYGSLTEDAGLALAGKAFASVFGRFGNMFVAFAVTFFAFSSLLGWSFYGCAHGSICSAKKACRFISFCLPRRHCPELYGVRTRSCGYPMCLTAVWHFRIFLALSFCPKRSSA